MNLSLGLKSRAKLHPALSAIEWDEGKLTYSQLECQVAELAHSLQHYHKLSKGAKIAIAMENCSEFIVILFAVWRAGMTAIPLNAKLHPKEFSWIFENAGMDLVFASQNIAREITFDKSIISIGDNDYKKHFKGESLSTVDLNSNIPAWIFYTSGTTGNPKGAVLTHQNLLAMSYAYFADVGEITELDTRLHCAPMSHGSGLYAIPFILKGANNIISPKGFDPDYITNVLSNRQNISFFAAPTMIKLLMQSDGVGGDISGLKTICYGGGPMYLSDIKKALQIFGPSLYQLYGQGESPMTISNITKKMHSSSEDVDLDYILSSVGTARTGVEVAIFSDKGEEMPPDTIGEIVTRSACVMSGYLNDDTATNKTLRNGWLYTGDLGKIDKSGILTLKDRSKDMIISGGMNIYPREIEDILIKLPTVKEVAVVGAKSKTWGEQVVAFLAGSATHEELDSFCLEHLARFKRPKKYIFLESLPKNNYGKILKKNLRDQLLGRTFD